MFHIHILGASGSGTTTLAKALSEKISYVHFDTDDFYWEKSEIPFTVKRPIDERISMLKKEFQNNEKWILSGSLISWGDVLIPYFDLVIFLYVPKEIRLQRIEKRELERYGDRIKKGGDRYQKCQDFLKWASSYDDTDENTSSRTYKNHMNWLDNLNCPVLKITGSNPVDENIEFILSKIDFN